MQKKTKIILIAVLILCLIAVDVQAQSYFVGSKNSDVYHYPWCHYVDNIKPENKVYFSSATEAINQGYRPCKVCNPPIPEMSTLGLAILFAVATGIAILIKKKRYLET